jgi:hypothetical protein
VWRRCWQAGRGFDVGAGTPYAPGGMHDERDGGGHSTESRDDNPFAGGAEGAAGSAAPAEARQGRRPSASRKPRAARPLISIWINSAVQILELLSSLG